MENIENIFEDAKFGDKFINKNNTLSVFLWKNTSYEGYYAFANSEGGFYYVDFNGYCDSDDDLSITSRYKETINEEKLEIFAEELAQELIAEPTGWIEELQRPELSYRDLKDAIKESYRKAKNEQN